MAAKHAPTLPHGPLVDERNMVYFGAAQRGAAAQAFFGPAPLIDPTSVRLARHEPRVDVSAQSPRWKVLTEQGRVGALEVASSLAMHAALILGALGFVKVFDARDKVFEESVPVEIAFGLGFEPRSFQKEVTKGDSDADVEALKSEQQLPQLAKSVAMEAPPQPVNDQSMPLPSAATPAPVPTSPDTKAQATPDAKPTLAAKVEKTPPPNVKTLTQEEYARRVERENRKVGKDEREGVQQDAKTGTKPLALNDLPNSPFAGKSIPDAPPGMGPTGSTEGKVSAAAKGEYQAAAGAHIRRFWNLPDLYQFEPNLEVIVIFQINMFGKIIDKVKVFKGSGNDAFDAEAIKAVESAAPFPEPPDELAPRVPMRMKFSPQEIKL